MILLDWTRMGQTYCLAGVVREGGSYRVVRPLPRQARAAACPNVGWSPFLVEGMTRWQEVVLVGPTLAEVRPPHVEDLCVRQLRPRPLLAAPEERRAILRATAWPDLFGHPLTLHRGTASLPPGVG